ncbi:RMD1 family protein [Acidithiobacillus sulfurivorans]|uniref:RMD1 family protein n=1 Tax=Acidithiobacillus sulfurivorans TaxID=1958756 RepID=A0ABS6A1R3_9PROT|nr:RMD1 family protein [Acidithiobacillus sulfurivorans]MBU2761452.1 RMD1 family protein [Acidithiobacillus sulfurivorans]
MSSILHAIQPVRHIALKNWDETFDMDLVDNNPAHRLLRDGDAWVAIFRSGVLCFFGAGPALQARIVASVQAQFTAISNPKVEELFIKTGERDAVGRDGVTLKHLDEERILLVSLRLAQSLALELHEEAVETLLETTLNLLSEVTRTGRLPGRRGSHLRFLASTSATRTEILSRLAVLDNPDIVWETPGLEILSRELSADLELTSRFRALDEKLDAIHEGLEIMIVASRHNRETVLEWIIIILITAEALIMLLGK